MYDLFVFFARFMGQPSNDHWKQLKKLVLAKLMVSLLLEEMRWKDFDSTNEAFLGSWTIEGEKKEYGKEKIQILSNT